MAQAVYQHTLPNGLVLLAEQMEHVRSAAFNILVPAGCAYDPPGQFGVATILADLITRGAGERDSRALSLALDALGVDRGEGVRVMNMRFGGSTLARSIPAALDIYADVLLRPHLPADELEAAQSLALQDIQGLEDSPEGLVMTELRRRYYPQPMCKDRLGRAEDIEKLTIDDVRSFHRNQFHPNGAIISVAGNIAWEPLKEQVQRLFGDWKPSGRDDLPVQPHEPVSSHIQKDTHQTHIGFAYPSVPVGHPDYYAARAAEGVLSGGMSARLFAEVREKRGLCYAIGVGHETFKDRGTMVGYAGTGVDRAQETLDVTLAELRKLKDGVADDEIDRVKAGLKSSLIMQEESTSARAASIASDWYFLGRIRDSAEIQAAIDGLTPKLVTDHLGRFPIRHVKVVTVGPKPLTVPE